MSSRALRRLQEGSGVQGLPCSEPLGSADSEEPSVTAPFAGARAKKTAPHLNPFDLVMFCVVNTYFSNDFYIMIIVKSHRDNYTNTFIIKGLEFDDMKTVY